MINLEISNYQNPYLHLNGNLNQSVKPFDLARAIVTIGRKSWGNTFQLGIFRIGELICKSLAFSKMDGNNLILHERFYQLNQSEKATISYYFGQGLTKLYAEEFFDIKWLFHVDEYIQNIQFNQKGTIAPKINIGRSNKTAERPDLIGIVKTNTSHIFEAKGSSTGYSSVVMQHAINQVSQIISYNNVTPLTRAACYFDLSQNPIKGIIIDPENDENGISYEFKEQEALNQFYAFFKENRDFFTVSFNIGEFNFITTAIGAPSIFFGFDERILNLSISEILENGLYNQKTFQEMSSNFPYEDMSLGIDGIIIINTLPLSR